MHIICSSQNVYNALKENNYPENVILHEGILSAQKYYNDASLVITRSGRNTLSELAVLGIPAITFVSGCSYRKVEQSNNIHDLNIPTIVLANLEIATEEFAELCVKMIGEERACHFQCGNDEAIKHIMQI